MITERKKDIPQKTSNQQNEFLRICMKYVGILFAEGRLNELPKEVIEQLPDILENNPELVNDIVTGATLKSKSRK